MALTRSERIRIRDQKAREYKRAGKSKDWLKSYMRGWSRKPSQETKS